MSRNRFDWWFFRIGGVLIIVAGIMVGLLPLVLMDQR